MGYEIHFKSSEQEIRHNIEIIDTVNITPVCFTEDYECAVNLSESIAKNIHADYYILKVVFKIGNVYRKIISADEYNSINHVLDKIATDRMFIPLRLVIPKHKRFKDLA